jgi:hypothetical protein
VPQFDLGISTDDKAKGKKKKWATKIYDKGPADSAKTTLKDEL